MVEVNLIIEENNFEDLSLNRQIEIRNKITDKVEIWVSEIIKRRIQDGSGKEEIEKLLGIF